MPYKDKNKQRLSAKKHYDKNKTKIKKRALLHKKIARKRNKDFLKNFLANSCCKDCRNNDERVLEFDHVKGIKRNNVTTLVYAPASIKTIIEEIKKCEIRCANCHKIRHYKERTFTTK